MFGPFTEIEHFITAAKIAAVLFAALVIGAVVYAIRGWL